MFFIGHNAPKLCSSEASPVPSTLSVVFEEKY